MLSSRGASSAAIKRLTIEYKQLSSDPTSLFPATGPIDESNYLLWEALVPGPEGTPFEGGVFSARLTFRTLLACSLMMMMITISLLLLLNSLDISS